MILLKRFVAYPESFTQSEAHDKKYYVFYKFVREDHGAEEQGAGSREVCGKYRALHRSRKFTTPYQYNS